MDFLFNEFGIFGFTFEFDISGVTVLISFVGDDLGAAIGKGNAISSGDYVSVGVLGVIEIVESLIILDVVSETVWLWNNDLESKDYIRPSSKIFTYFSVAR